MKEKVKKSDKKTRANGATVARVTEITASSPKSFEHAIEVGVARACKTLEHVTSAWIQEQKIEIRDGKIHAYRVNMKVTFILNE
ncbi:MAG: dodecin domain-containing protein [Planctomyces sp.]|nr:dodecin domain-containing protein [Planctomyces sp.]